MATFFPEIRGRRRLLERRLDLDLLVGEALRRLVRQEQRQLVDELPEHLRRRRHVAQQPELVPDERVLHLGDVVQRGAPAVDGLLAIPLSPSRSRRGRSGTRGSRDTAGGGRRAPARCAASASTSASSASASTTMRPTSRKSSSSNPRIVAACVPTRTPDATVGGRSSNGTVLRFVGQPDLVEPLLGVLARPLGRAEVDLEEVRVGTAREEVEPAADQRLREDVGVRPDLLLVRPELLGGRDLEARRLCGDHVLERAALEAREDRAVDRLRVLLAAEDEPRARAGKRLVRRRRDDVAVLDRVRMEPGRDQPREVRHVAPEQRADLVGDAPEHRGVDGARVRRAAADDQLRPVLAREGEHLLLLDELGLPRHAVVDDRVEPTGEVDLEAVRQVAAVVEAEREDGVARLRAARCRRPCSPGRPRAAGRSRARRRRAPSHGRSRAARSRRRTRSRRSSGCPGTPRRTCSWARSRRPRAPTAT